MARVSGVTISVYRLICLIGVAIPCGWSLTVIFLLACGQDISESLVPVTSWRIEAHVSPNHSKVQSWAESVIATTNIPRAQVAVAEQMACHLVRYWDAYEVWGCNSFIPTIDEMIDRAHQESWETLRGNCVAQSIVLCSVLRSLGFHAKICTKPTHAWVRCVVEGREVDLLYSEEGQASDDIDLPATPLHGGALVAARSLGADATGQFHTLEFLPQVKGPAPYFARPHILWALIPVAGIWLVAFCRLDLTTARRAAKRNQFQAMKPLPPFLAVQKPKQVYLLSDETWVDDRSKHSTILATLKAELNDR